MNTNSNDVVHVDLKTNYSLQEIIQKQEKHLKEQRGVLFLARYFIWPFVILIASISNAESAEAK